MKTRNLTVMFTDMKEFTSRTSSVSRKQVEHLLTLHDKVIRPIFTQFGGTVVKTIGDAFLVTFDSPTDAVLCGMKIQETVQHHNENAPTEERFEVRVAINSGEVHLKDGDVYGEPVNIAARIEAIAEPNEIYFTEAVYLTMNKNEIPSSEVGSRHLKGIPEQIRVYKVLRERKSPLKKKGKITDPPVAGFQHHTPGDKTQGHDQKIARQNVEAARSRATTYVLVAIGITVLLISLIVFGVLASRRKPRSVLPNSQPTQKIEQQLKERVENVIREERNP